MDIAATGIVLAGGQSRRMGQDKAALVLNDQTLLERSVVTLRFLTNEVLIVGGRHSVAGAELIPDRFPGTGPLGGLLAGLHAASRAYAMVVACDLPFLNPDLLRYLLSLAPGNVAVVPLFHRRPQPLCAIYARDAAMTLENCLQAGELRLSTVLDSLRVRWVEDDELIPFDPERSLVNVNTLDEWNRLLTKAELDKVDR